MKQGKVDVFVGVFIILAIIALMFTAVKVSGLTVGDLGSNRYDVTAQFSDIGGLKVRSPVKLAGVQIGSVSSIKLNKNAYNAIVTLSIQKGINTLPLDTSARISQSGLLGDNYISLAPGYSEKDLKRGDRIKTTYSATSLTSLISTFVSGSGGTKK